MRLSARARARARWAARCSSATPAPRRTRRRSSSRAARGPAGTIVVVHGRLPRPHLRRAVGDAAGVKAGAVRAAGPGVRRRRRRTPRRSRAAVDEQTAAVLLEPIQGETRRSTCSPTSCCWRRATRATATGAALDLRRDPDRDGPDRHAVGLRADRRRPRRADERQGARRRAADRRARHRRARSPNVLQPGDHGSTFAGGPVACAAALVALEICSDPELLARVRAARRAAGRLARRAALRLRRPRARADAGVRRARRRWRTRAGAPRAARAAARRQRHRAGDDPIRAAADRRRRTRSTTRSGACEGFRSERRKRSARLGADRGADAVCRRGRERARGRAGEHRRRGAASPSTSTTTPSTGCLRASGLALVHEGGRLSLRDAATMSERAGAPLRTAGDEPMLGDELPPGALRDALRAGDRRPRAAAACPRPTSRVRRARACSTSAARRSCA